MAENELTTNVTLIRGLIGKTSGSKTIIWEPQSSSDEVPIMTVPEVLNFYPIIDIVHIDIQGEETALFLPEVSTFLSKRVRLLHIGTHHTDILRDLQNIYKEPIWKVLHVFDAGGVVQTEMGPIRLAFDGELSVQNMELCPFDLSAI
jgi:hypothetical protein